ncbi:MAG: cation:proton antiporter [Thermoleophilaceae bacterium]
MPSIGPFPPGVAPGLDPFQAFPAEALFAGIALFAAIGALSFEEERPFSAAIAYVALGVAGAIAIEVFDIGWLSVADDAALIQHIAELALIVALFGTGVVVESPLRPLTWRVVASLIVVAMPLTIAAVAAFGTLAMGLSLGAAIALGAILAPTDPVLAGGIGIRGPQDRGDDRRGRGRFNLSGEAALNDSLASPFALLAVFVATEPGAGWLGEWVLFDVVYSVIAAAAVGGIAGYGIGRLAIEMRDRHLLSPELDGFVVIGAVLVVFGAAELIDAYGLLAVFAAGLGFRRYEFEHEYNQRIHQSAQVAQNFAELVVILVLGSLVTTDLLSEPGLAGWLLVPLLLCVIRPVAVLAATSLARSTMNRGERALVAWFGVKGVAAVYFVALPVEEKAIAGSEAQTVFWTTVAAVIASILVHGATADPLSRRLLDEPP